MIKTFARCVPEDGINPNTGKKYSHFKEALDEFTTNFKKAMGFVPITMLNGNQLEYKDISKFVTVGSLISMDTDNVTCNIFEDEASVAILKLLINPKIGFVFICDSEASNKDKDTTEVKKIIAISLMNSTLERE